MKISDMIAEHPKRKTIKGDATVHELSQLLREENVGAVIVSNDGTSVEGIISERDIAYRLSERRGHFHLVRVSTLMTKKVVTCTPEDHVKDALLLMSEHRIRHVPVVEGEQIVGLVSMRDVMELRLGALEKRTSVLRSLVEIYEPYNPSCPSTISK